MRAFEVATAQVHGQCHACGLQGHHFVDELGIAVGQFVGVVTALASSFTHVVVAQVGQVGVVHLHIGATGVGQRLQLFAISLGHVVIKLGIQLGVMGFADARAATPEVQHGGGGNGHLGHATAARGHLAFKVFKVGALNVFHVLDLVHHLHHGGSQLFHAIRAQHGDRDIGRNATQLLQKVDVKVSATELAIGDAFKAHIFLKLHDVGDGLVFHSTQLLSGDFAFGFLLAGIQQKFRA